MSISIPPQAVSSNDPEHAQPSQESLCPSSMEISIQEVAETTFPDLLDEDPYSAIYKTLVPYLSEKDCYNLTLTCKRNYRTVSKIFLLSLLGKKDVDYQSLETWRKRCILADENVLQAELTSLLTSFGITYPYKDRRWQTRDRITTILNALNGSHLFTGTEKRYFATLSAEKIFEKPTLLYLLLQTADRHNLVQLSGGKCPLNNEKIFNETTFPQKVALVLKFFQDKKNTIQEVSEFASCLTNIPNEVCNLTRLKKLLLTYNKIEQLPESIGNLTQLERLSLIHNKITELPESIGNLTQLHWLDLGSNHITKLPEWIGKLSQLKGLDLSENPTEELPKSIGNLIQLEELNLSKTQITELPEALSRLPELTICLSRNDIVYVPGSLASRIKRW